MNRYFILPVSIFFFIVIYFVLYFQFYDDEWKYFFKPEKKNTPEYCKDNSQDLKKTIINLNIDKQLNRYFIDNKDNDKKLVHLIYLVPCDQLSRNFDINNKIEKTIFNINEWFFKNSDKQKIKFDYKDDFLDITFIRVNKSLNWFNTFNSIQNKSDDNASRVEKIIYANKNIFNNFDDKKFIVFFEGWEKRKSFFHTTCGRARYDGQVAVIYTNSDFKNKDTCSVIIEKDRDELGSEEQLIIHELLHLLGFPNKCSTNNVSEDQFHVNDSADDILFKFSGGKYLDFNNDDYYNHSIADCQDLKDSKYLITY